VTASIGPSDLTNEDSKTEQPPPRPPEPAAEPAATPAEENGDEHSDEADAETWSMVKDSDDPADVEFYLDNFPNGRFVVPARLRLRQLGR